MKRMFFVSTGRCGTTRIAELLKLHVPQNFTVLHQTKFSRRANILGNILYHFSIGKGWSNQLFKQIIHENVPVGHILISTDPLTSMILPDKIIKSPNTIIIHIIRDAPGFAHSMYCFTRKKKKSFIAHNLVPFWQPYLWPFENMLSKSIIDKYKKIHTEKNLFLEKQYSDNPNYIKLTTDIIFTKNTISNLMNKYFNVKINIPQQELIIKTNSSRN